MGSRTPRRIEENILIFWLSGLPRKEVAEKAGVSVGTVLKVVKEAKTIKPDIDLMRGLAVTIRKKEWNLDILSSAVRHRNMLYRLSLTDEQIDDLIDEHCFKKGMTFSSFWVCFIPYHSHLANTAFQ